MGMTPALALWVADLSAAEDRYRAALVAEAFARGRETGRDEGRREYEAEETAAWRLLLGRYRDIIRSPAFAQIERRRYGPGGRESWIIRRPDSPEERERLASAGLPPNAGRWPKDIRRRALRRGEPDPFHIRHGPQMECTACAWWGLPCPGDEEPGRAGE
jgi:hypothetical protein